MFSPPDRLRAEHCSDRRALGGICPHVPYGSAAGARESLGNAPVEASLSRVGAFPTLHMWNVPKRFFECSSGALHRRIGQKSDLTATLRVSPALGVLVMQAIRSEI
jgi:hypothetical protein